MNGLPLGDELHGVAELATANLPEGLTPRYKVVIQGEVDSTAAVYKALLATNSALTEAKSRGHIQVSSIDEDLRF